MRSTTPWLELATSTRLGARLLSHHLQQRGYIDAGRGIAAVIRGYGGQASGGYAVDIVADELDRTDDVAAALAAAARRLPKSTEAQGLQAGVTALVFRPPIATTVHIGAARAIRVRGGVVQRLTQDHVLELGDMLGGRPVLTRVLGVDQDAIDMAHHVIDAGDGYMVLDDTVARAISDAELVGVISQGDALWAAERLADLAHARVLDRNATAVVAVVRRARERL